MQTLPAMGSQYRACLIGQQSGEDGGASWCEICGEIPGHGAERPRQDVGEDQIIGSVDIRSVNGFANIGQRK